MDKKIKPSSQHHSPRCPFFKVEPDILRAAVGVQKESNPLHTFFFLFNIEIGVGGSWGCLSGLVRGLIFLSIYCLGCAFFWHTARRQECCNWDFAISLPTSKPAGQAASFLAYNHHSHSSQQPAFQRISRQPSHQSATSQPAP